MKCRYWHRVADLGTPTYLYLPVQEVELCFVPTMHSNLDISAPTDLTSSKAALQFIEAAGLQAPSPQELEEIIDAAVRATGLFALVAVLPLEESDIREFFSDFVVRCVNRGPGVGDAATN